MSLELSPNKGFKEDTEEEYLVDMEWCSWHTMKWKTEHFKTASIMRYTYKYRKVYIYLDPQSEKRSGSTYIKVVCT